MWLASYIGLLQIIQHNILIVEILVVHSQSDEVLSANIFYPSWYASKVDFLPMPFCQDVDGQQSTNLYAAASAATAN